MPRDRLRHRRNRRSGWHDFTVYLWDMIGYGASTAHRLAEQILGAELRLVPEAGHLIQVDAPEQLTAILFRWLLSEKARRTGR